MLNSIEDEKQHKIWEDLYGDMELEEVLEKDEDAHYYFISHLTLDELAEYDYDFYIERMIDMVN